MKALDKRQKILLGGIALALALALAAVLLTLTHPAPDRAAEEPAVSVIPEADLDEEDGSKAGSYRKGGSISDYWDELGDDVPSPETVVDGRADSTAAPSPQGSHRPPPVDVDDIFGDYRDAGREPAPAPARRRSPSPAAKPSNPEPAASDKGGQEPPAPEPVRIQVKRSGAVSSLDEDAADDLGSGFSTLDGADRWVDGEAGKPYRCMFTRDEKVRSGQRITVRLLEDLVIDGVHVPRNTHLQGVVTVSDRMEVSVTSLDVGGRILTFHFEAFDTDGGKGIYCSDLNQAGKAAAEQGLSTAGGLLSSRLGRVARDAASVGASIVRNKAGEATVSVPAGYTFYIIQQTR